MHVLYCSIFTLLCVFVFISCTINYVYDYIMFLKCIIFITYIIIITMHKYVDLYIHTFIWAFMFAFLYLTDTL